MTARRQDDSDAAAESGDERYPDYRMPYVAAGPDHGKRFADDVEAFLLGYGYQTARAYRADLEDLYLWADERRLDFFELNEADIKRYATLMRRRKYSEGTIRRRLTAYRGLRARSAREADR